MMAISVMIKPASNLCNMSCDYCFYCDESKKRHIENYGMMTDQTLKNVIRKTLLRAEYSVTYAFQGGEPTLCGIKFFERVLSYQKQYNKKNILVNNVLQTNGYAITEEWCRFFKKNNFLIGLSVDGIESTHNHFRHSKKGENTFLRVLNAAKLMDQYQVDYNILTVVTPQITKNVSLIYEFYKSQKWDYQQYIACIDPLDEQRGLNDYSLNAKEYGRFLVDLFGLWYKDYEQGRQPYIRQFENYIQLAVGMLPEACDQRGVCGVQNVVEADGSVYPCDFYMLDEFCLGNFNVNNLEQINQKRIEIGFLERSYKLDSTCKTCQYYNLCRGGCQRYRDVNEDSSLYSNYFCDAYRIFFDVCYTKIIDIANQIRRDGR